MNNASSLAAAKILAVSLASVSLATPGIAADIYWSGATGDLMDGANWTGGAFPGASNVGAISNGGTATLSSGSATLLQLWAGNSGDASTGTFIQTGGTLTLSQGGVSGRGAGGNGTWIMSGGTLNTADFRVGGGTGTATTPQTSVGTMTVSNAGTAVNSTGYVGIGSSGTGTLTLSDGASWTHAGGTVFLIGGDNNAANQAGGTGTLNVNSGASLKLTGAANLSLGRNTSTTTTTGNGTLNVNGGSVTLNTGTLNFGSTQGGTQLAGRGTLTITSGSITAPSGIRFNEGTGTANFNGGTTTIGGIVKTMGTGTGTANFNGGIIKAAASTEDFVTFSGTTGTGVVNLNVLSGGLKFDTNGFDVTISQTLNGSGGLTKLGAGTLTFSSLTGVGYTGDTAILEGTLSLQTASLADASSVWLSTGGVFDLAFNGTDTVGQLFINGVAQASGTWGAIGSGATYTSDLFTGTGLLLVAVPEPAHYALAVGGLLAALIVLRRRSLS